MVATVIRLKAAATTVHYFEADGYYARNDPEHRKASGFRNGAVDVKQGSSQRSGLARPLEHGAPSPAAGPLAGMVSMIDTGGCLGG